jgi:hypothetical protein
MKINSTLERFQSAELQPFKEKVIVFHFNFDVRCLEWIFIPWWYLMSFLFAVVTSYWWNAINSTAKIQDLVHEAFVEDVMILPWLLHSIFWGTVIAIYCYHLLSCIFLFLSTILYAMLSIENWENTSFKHTLYGTVLVLLKGKPAKSVFSFNDLQRLQIHCEWSDGVWMRSLMVYLLVGICMPQAAIVE